MNFILEQIIKCLCFNKHVICWVSGDFDIKISGRNLDIIGGFANDVENNSDRSFFGFFCECFNKFCMSYLPNYNPNCNNSLEWAEDIEKQVEDKILKISLNLSSHKPKERESCLDILSKQLQKEKTKLKRLYTLYAEGNDTVLEMIKET